MTNNEKIMIDGLSYAKPNTVTFYSIGRRWRWPAREPGSITSE